MVSGVFNQAMQRILDQSGPVRLIIAGLSGGMDSITLVSLLSEWRTSRANPPALIAAHMHHGIRGEDADKDADFCREFAGRLGIEFASHAVDVPKQARTMRLGLEEAGRRLRYQFFHSLANRVGSKSALVVTGHHADDQAETILLHLRRGAHRRGLSGMKEWTRLPVPPDANLMAGKPLLAIGRDALRQYALTHELAWREDETNRDEGFARNHIRHRIIPMLESLVPGFRERLLAKAGMLAAEEKELGSSGAQLAASLSRRENGGLFFSITPDACTDTERFMYALRHVIEEEMGGLLPHGSILSNLADLAMRGETGDALALPGKLVARREHDGLFFHFPDALPAPETTEIILPDPPFDIDAAGLHVSAEWRSTDGMPPPGDMADPDVEWLNPAAIRWPLRLRPPRPGERFRPMGAPGSRKIQDILVDVKSPRRKRAMPRVIADYAGGLWLWPYRLANRAALVGVTTKALRLVIRENYE